MEEKLVKTENSSMEISKSANFPNKILFINGWEGCGKTCISSVFNSVEGIENMRYSTEIEMICHLWLSNNLDQSAASTCISTLADYIIYNLFQSREINIRPSDISCVMNGPILPKYISCLLYTSDAADE